jgi:predicted nucleic acid-binding protein
VNAVFDTSPLCYLVLIDEIEIAARLFDTTYVPHAVAEELSHPGAPRAVRDWIREAPEWLRIENPKPVPIPSSLIFLNAGEREAILLARDLGADHLVVDEKAARQAAQAMGLRVTGLLGLLVRAAERKMIDLPRAVRRLEQTSFHVSPGLLKSLLDPLHH